MRIISSIIGFISCLLVSAQLTVKPLPKKQVAKTPIVKSATRATLPFWDDFSIQSSSPDSTRTWGNVITSQWNYEASINVQVSGTLAINPPTYGAATFDGLKADGTYHGDGKGLTDQLVSDSIDLSSYTEFDDVYLSFYWQAGGNVEIPEKGDSISLQFYDPLADKPWHTVWLMDGEDVEYDSLFYQESIKLEQRFLTDQFVFRFQSYGDQFGPFDAWHIDYVYLNANRGSEDYYYLDRGFTGQLTSPFGPFKALPISQFKANSMEYTGPQTAQAFNLDRFLQPTEYVVVLRELVNNIQIDALQFGAENPLLPNPNPLIHSVERRLTFDGFDLALLPDQDSLVLSSELYIESSDDDYLDGTIVDLRINDTLRTEYLLYDYYAFDDGTAEYAAGNNIRGGGVGIQYWVQTQDTLTHIDICFPNIEPSSSGAFLTLQIFKDLTSDVAMRTQSITVENAKEINGFTRYELTRPLIVSDTFYITYEQNVNRYIGVGFDRSNQAASRYLFDKIDGEWIRNNRLKGTLMIRPVFKPVADFTLGVEEIEELIIYPNPVQDGFSIEGEYTSIQLYNLNGQLLLSEEKASSHLLHNISPGLYLLTIKTPEGSKTQKLIKQ